MGWRFSSIALFLAVTISLFNNCQQVAFSIDQASLSNRLSETGAIIINDGAKYANSRDVQLTIFNRDADEMFVTNEPNCNLNPDSQIKSGTGWQKYSQRIAWQLKDRNKLSHVFAKFRNSSAPQVESACFSDSIIHDDLPPLVLLMTMPPRYTNKKTFPFVFSATDLGSGLAGSFCQKKGEGTQACLDHWTLVQSEEGPAQASFQSVDRAGNSSEPVSVTLTFDFTKPKVVAIELPSSISSNPKPKFHFTATDNLSPILSLTCQLNNEATFQDCGALMCIFQDEAKVKDCMDRRPPLLEGQQIIRVKASDEAGNESEEFSYTWQIDLTRPSLELTKKPQPFDNRQTADFEFIGMDSGKAITKFSCSAGAAPSGSASAPSPLSSCSSPKSFEKLVHGKKTFQLQGQDSVGNPSDILSYKWLVDLHPPAITLLTKPREIINSSSVSISFSPQDNSSNEESGIDKSECKLDGGAYIACQQNATYTGLSDGNHTISVRTFDKAGNMTISPNINFVADTVKPSLEITEKPSAVIGPAPAIFVMKAFDAPGKIDHLECSFDSASSFSICESPFTKSNLSEGAHNFFARAIDQAGNISDVKSVSFQMDLTGPAINISKMPEKVVGIYDSLEFGFAVTDLPAGVKSVRCGLDGDLEDCSINTDKKFTQQLTTGSHYFTITAADNVGNTSQKTIDFIATDNTRSVSQLADVSLETKVDVLVVMDNSGSMYSEMINMARRFNTFLDQMNGKDWQVAIITTDVSRDSPKKDGRLVELVGLPDHYIINSQMAATLARKLFADTIQMATNGSGNEQGIAATYRSIERALDPTNPLNEPNRQFFRDGASLSVIVVTDSDETNSLGTLPYNTPSALQSLIRDHLGNRAFLFSGFVAPTGDTACRGSSETYGVAYEQLAKLTGGTIHSVCLQDYGPALTNLGIQTAQILKVVTLDCLPLDLNFDGKPDVVVRTADHSPAPSSTVEGLKVSFSKSLPLGSNYLDYRCLSP